MLDAISLMHRRLDDESDTRSSMHGIHDDQWPLVTPCSLGGQRLGAESPLALWASCM